MNDPENAPLLQIQTSVQPGPDGSPWVGLHIAQGTSMYVIVMDPSNARALALQIAPALKDGAKAAEKVSSEQTNGKLVVAPANALDSLRKQAPMNPKNGR